MTDILPFLLFFCGHAALFSAIVYFGDDNDDNNFFSDDPCRNPIWRIDGKDASGFRCCFVGDGARGGAGSLPFGKLLPLGRRDEDR